MPPLFLSPPHTHPHPPAFFFPSFRSRRRVPSGTHRLVNGTSGRRRSPSRHRTGGPEPPSPSSPRPGRSRLPRPRLRASRAVRRARAPRRHLRAAMRAVRGARAPGPAAAARGGEVAGPSLRSGAARGSPPAHGAGSTGLCGADCPPWKVWEGAAATPPEALRAGALHLSELAPR